MEEVNVDLKFSQKLAFSWKWMILRYKFGANWFIYLLLRTKFCIKKLKKRFKSGKINNYLVLVHS